MPVNCVVNLQKYDIGVIEFFFCLVIVLIALIHMNQKLTDDRISRIFPFLDTFS